MDDRRWLRLQAHLQGLKPLARLLLEGATGTLELEDTPLAQAFRAAAGDAREGPTDCSADLLFPIDQHALLLLTCRGRSLPGGRSRNLRLSGTHPTDGPWTLHAPEIDVRLAGAADGGARWGIATPINHPLTIRYGHPRPVTRAVALINGICPAEGIVVQAGRVTLRFRGHTERQLLEDLLDARILRTASISQVEFAWGDGASDTDLLQFGVDIGTLCTYATGRLNGVPLMTTYDASDCVVQRFLISPVDGRRSSYPVLVGGHTPKGLEDLFSQCFEEHQRMRRSPLPWRMLPSYCGSIEDGSYLEQKFASTMMALEFFIRTSLREVDGPASTRYRTLTLPPLIRAARETLGWTIPGHYLANDLYRQLRNAVAHGGVLPTRDSAHLRHEFDKWRLFLFRRVLMRLGYKGRVYSPERGWAASSSVDDFSEEHNSFES